jgi:hypothetical protein
MSKPEQPVKQDPKIVIPVLSKKSPMMFFPAKGLGSYHAFSPTDEKSRKLFRSAVLQYGTLAGLQNADEALASVLPKGFSEEAAAHGWTLKEAMLEVQAYYTSHTPPAKAKRESVDSDTRCLAGILAGLSPNDIPVALLKQLRGLIEEKGEAAVKHLERFEQEAGRDSAGYIYLRKVTR